MKTGSSSGTGKRTASEPAGRQAWELEVSLLVNLCIEATLPMPKPTLAERNGAGPVRRAGTRRPAHDDHHLEKEA